MLLHLLFGVFNLVGFTVVFLYPNVNQVIRSNQIKPISFRHSEVKTLLFKGTLLQRNQRVKILLDIIKHFAKIPIKFPQEMFLDM